MTPSDGLHESEPERHSTTVATGVADKHTRFASTQHAVDVDLCPDCGQPLSRAGLEEFLNRLGISEEMVGNLENRFQDIDIDEYLNTARDWVKESGSRAQAYAKENPATVVVGAAALLLGAGLIYSYGKSAGARAAENRLRHVELDWALQGPKYPLDEVLRDLGVTV